MSFDRITLLLSLQRALLGVVTPALRMVTAEGNDEEIHLIFYYDATVSNWELELAETAATEVIASFAKQTLNLEILKVNGLIKLHSLEEIAYQRYEEIPKPIE